MSSSRTGEPNTSPPSTPTLNDALHNPDARSVKLDNEGNLNFSSRGLANLGCLIFLCTGILTLFIGYPVASYARHKAEEAAISNHGGINVIPTQIPSMGNFGPIDHDTPLDVYTKTSYRDGLQWQLVFSDEFNTDGRSFYPGDDPYWEAADLHYWATNNLEWYDPEAVTTENGSLVITFSEMVTHDLNYQGGGLIETSVQLPGTNNVVGMWPAVWTMGNLGRAGYGATLEGTWPYTYDSCDVGTVPNQTRDGFPLPATINGDPSFGYALSYLPGQKLSRCTCEGEDHPGPKHTDGGYVGRSAPEIDVFEAQITGHPLTGQVSQSAQWAPFNHAWIWENTTENINIDDPTISVLNRFIGSATQQATSVVTNTNQRCYELLEECYSVYGFELGYDEAYISWVSDDRPAWTIKSGGLGPDHAVEISARPVPQEPMYIIINLGMSKNFGVIDFQHLQFPNRLRIDWVRIYQHPDAINIGCNPENFPTEDYINRHMEAYTNSNLTTWRDDYKKPFPKNSFLHPCSPG
ncbi:glycoside hydrolase family 16 protein [Collybia nuda]|uniref:Glycoside hydrolase family 16 protein n=1 Tax=Collybia nuda TaxID=64659 RepID=A0A9P5Y9Z9_9AGAR|nr:glycoside hydrolase family 16 protein [Collybia nuda]